MKWMQMDIRSLIILPNIQTLYTEYFIPLPDEQSWDQLHEGFQTGRECQSLVSSSEITFYSQ